MRIGLGLSVNRFVTQNSEPVKMAIEREMPQKLILPSRGTRVTFGG